LLLEDQRGAVIGAHQWWDKLPIQDQADVGSGDQTSVDQPAESQAGETGVEMNDETIQLDEQGSIEGASVLLFKIYVDTDGNGRLERAASLLDG
jgi:hypothetical protein